MKLNVTYKNPDALYYAVDDALENFLGDRHEREEEYTKLMDALIEILGSTEYLTVEVDTEAGTAVIKRRK